jgi:hypothetical protein
MPISSSELFRGASWKDKGPWKDIHWLIAETTKFYDEFVTPKGLGDRFSLAAKKIIPARGWEPCLRLIESNLDPILRDLRVFYIPTQMKLGPSIVFPQLDYRSILTHYKLYPQWNFCINGQPTKYVNLGLPVEEGHPSWFGDTDWVLRSIKIYGRVLIVEGFFDVLAVRLLAPHVPVISSGSKRLNEAHIDYLGILGVKAVELMLDNEAGKQVGRDGAGIESARYLAKKFKGWHSIKTWDIHNCPAKDPSDCLRDRTTAHALRRQLLSLFPVDELTRGIERRVAPVRISSQDQILEYLATGKASYRQPTTPRGVITPDETMTVFTEFIDPLCIIKSTKRMLENWHH